MVGFFYGISFLETRTSKTIKEIAKNNNIYLEIDKTDLGFPPQLLLTKITVLLLTGQIPTPVSIDSLNIVPKILPFFTMSAVVGANSKLYEGSVDAEIDSSLIGNKVKLNATATNITLHAHPILKTLGLRAVVNADINLVLDKTKPGLAAINSGQFKFGLDGGQLETAFKIYSLFPIPKFTNASANFLITVADQKVLLENFYFKSSLGSATGQGRARILNEGKIGLVVADFDLDLTDDGAKQLNPYLALNTGLQADETKRKWKINLRQENSGPLHWPVISIE